MSIDLTQLPVQLGDYELLELLSDDGVVLTYIAKQSLIQRYVIFSLVNPQLTDPSITQAFLDSARAKAKVKEGRICSVFEATHNDGLTYCTQEFPSGESLERLGSAGTTFEPFQIVHILKELAVTEYHYQQHNLKVSPWTPSSVFLERNGETRFLNLVESGERLPEETARDLHAVGSFFPSLVAQGQPGATRVLTLCSWMTGGPNAPKDITWETIIELCDTIIEQLASSQPNATTLYIREKKSSKTTLILGGILGLIIVASLALIFFSRNSSSDTNKDQAGLPSLPLEKDVKRPDKTISVYDKETNSTKKLSVDLHEVTIAAYEEFLHAIARMSIEKMQGFRNPDEPEEKRSYIPRDWMAMKDAAYAGSTWNGRSITLLTPVTNVDYWDALAYAKWAGRRLPTLSEWQALRGDNNALNPKRDPNGPVCGYSNDITQSGIGGLAGGVAEWTSTEEVDLAMPMSGKKPVISGGSYENNSDSSKKDFINSRNSYRPDLGFRTIKDE